MKRFLKILVRIAILLLLVCTAIGATGCESEVKRANTQNTWSRIKQRKKVVIGIDETFVPFGYQNKKGKIVGYDVDLANAAFKTMGIKPDFQPIDWNMNTTELRNKTIDVIWNGFSITPQRKRVCAFSKPYVYGGYNIVTLRKNHINNIKDMNGKSLGVQGGSSDQQTLDQQPKILKDRIKNRKPILYGTYNDALSDLKSGRVDALLIDSANANYYISHESDPAEFKQFNSPFPAQYDAVGFRKGDVTLRKKVNQALIKLSKSGKLAKINKKWFGPKYNTNKLPLLIK
ncbi:amino acid ABC transporter substrate-binding protein [Acetilactobacillus jinshanensis]|uniref:Amino acid ABC transporter substrate-binding protein n=1 Tax=Acetilactobacillus jinshanensis TaxID=1720083 RepID=A0A4P6ZM18_9LACO|nr:amino acid ABC transporter substrate-binding protein [Acetilactobacillus jinshanensis]QBP18824.1 amino acid ABC transporter substrate-binding protein [Acetilactobacillus jinshanensis]URL61690.1 amino acid ABC transporter substrate-binding protein [uncultured bacterium]